MNCTFQSCNYRERQGTRPFYDLIAKSKSKPARKAKP